MYACIPECFGFCVSLNAVGFGISLPPTPTPDSALPYRSVFAILMTKIPVEASLHMVPLLLIFIFVAVHSVVETLTFRSVLDQTNQFRV